MTTVEKSKLTPEYSNALDPFRGRLNARQMIQGAIQRLRDDPAFISDIQEGLLEHLEACQLLIACDAGARAEAISRQYGSPFPRPTFNTPAEDLYRR